MTPPRSRPILFSTPMVRAIIDGSKTQTRRVVKPALGREAHWTPFEDGWQANGLLGDIPKGWTSKRLYCPFGEVGDQLWVRETFWQTAYYPSSGDESERIQWGESIHYAADGDPENTPNRHYPKGLRGRSISAPDPYAVWLKRPSIHMERLSSRIDLEITGVRVERLGSINSYDLAAEGFSSLDMFRETWDAIHGCRAWSRDKDKWVWAVSFRRIDAPAASPQPAVHAKGGHP